MSSFLYTQLQSPDREIRLLILEAGEGDNPIQCEIMHVDIDDSPPYEALSYTWGSPDKGTDILVDGSPFSVRQNLFWALMHLRKVDNIQVMWIDAVCINQLDTEERNQQVTQMKRIYQMAERVVVWLGRSDYSTKSIFTFFSKTARAVISQYPAYAMVNFCKLEYWQRLWIIQEVLSASKIRIQSGFQSVEWDDLTTMFLQCRNLNLEMFESENSDAQDRRRKHDPSVDSIVREGVLSQLVLQRSHQIQNMNSQDLSLIPLLHKYRDSKCEDIRDRVFGLLSLAPECCISTLKVDYGATRAQVQQTILQHSRLAHGLMDEKDYFEAAVEICRTLQIPTDEVADKIYNLKLLYPTDGKKTVPWVHSTIGIVSEPLNPNSYQVLSAYLDHKREYYRAHKEDNPDWEYPVWDHEVLQKEYEQGHPKEGGILDSLRDVALKLNIEHLDRLKDNIWCCAFMDTEGMSGIGPQTIRTGDLICQFPVPRYAMILRPCTENSYQIIAKSANCDSLLSSIPTPAERPSSKLKVYDDDGRTINFYMDKSMMRYSHGLRDPGLNFKGCRETSALGRLLTRDELDEQYSLSVNIFN